MTLPFSQQQHHSPPLTKSHKITKPLIFSRSLIERPNRSDEQNSVYLSQDNLLKFFPKYIHELRIEISNGYVISKVKRLKTLHIFQGYPNPNQSSNIKRTLLYNKARHIQKLYDEDGQEFQYTRQILQEVKSYTGLQVLKLPSPQSNLDLSLTQTQQFYFLNRICRHVKILHKLQHLDLEIHSHDYLRTISKLNSFTNLLDSLRVLRIECKWKEEDDASLFQDLLQSKNLLKSATHLKLPPLSDQTFRKAFANILSFCPKLTFLSFTSDSILDGDGNCSKLPIQESTQYLQSLQNLKNLQTLHINIKNDWAFLNDFTLPPSTRHVSLHFQTLPTSLYFDPRLMGTYSLVFKTSEDLPPIFLSFCEKWNNFPELNRLEISFFQVNDFSGKIILFLRQWLPRVKNVKELSLELSSSSFRGRFWNKDSNQKDLDLSLLLDSIKHLENSLESLRISDKRLIYCFKNLPQHFFGGFRRLHKLSIEGFMPQEIEIEGLFEIGLRGLMTVKNNEKPFEVELDGLGFDSVDAFVRFVKIFDRRSERKREVKINISAYLTEKKAGGNDFTTFSQYFKLSARDLLIQIKVSSQDKFSQGNNPRDQLKENLEFLKFME